MRRRPNTPSVTLFPFLAVLVCTMGALIFLLLVITQKIQKQSQLPLVAIEQHVIEEPNIEALPPLNAEPVQQIPLTPTVVELPEFDDDEPILPLLAGNSLEDHQWLEAEYEARQRALQRQFERELKQRNEKQRALDKKLQAEAVALAMGISKKQKQRQQLIKSRQKIEDELAQLDEMQKRAGQGLLTSLHQLEEAQRVHQREQEQRIRLQNQAANLTRQIARIEEQNSNAIPETEIVAYDSVTGTSRKPILIECRKSEIVFASEGIVLPALDLSGFPPEYNPLKAGAEALLKYWRENGEPHQRPYILLIVRPEGTTGFYIARGLLADLDHKFGYELVEKDRTIRWPATDPIAAQYCRAAVMKVLSERKRVAAKLGRSASINDGPLSYANSAGEFHLPEAKSFDQSGSGNFFGDEKWISPKSRSANSKKNLNLFRQNQSRQQGEPPRSIVRPTPSESANPLFGSRPGPTYQPNATQKLIPGSSTEQPNMPQSGTSQTESSQLSQRMPRQLSAMNAKPLQSPGSSSPQTENPFEKQQPAAQSQGVPRFGTKPAPPQRTGVIGIERETEIHLWPTQFCIDDELALRVPTGASSADIKQAVTSAISETTAEWDTPPKAYFWKPVVKIVIHPGGLLHYAKVKELLDKWKIPATVEYELQ